MIEGLRAPPPREALDLVFMGTPAFAATILEALIEAGHHIRAVYTQPPRPAGRGHRPQPSPVQLLATQHRISVRCPAWGELRSSCSRFGNPPARCIAMGKTISIPVSITRN